MRLCALFCCAATLSVGCGRADYDGTSLESTAVTAVKTGKAVVPGAKRKIVYTAEISLVVKDFAAAEAAMAKLLRKHDGYLAKLSIDRTSGEHRNGTWSVRIPVANYDKFIQSTSELGHAVSQSQSIKDVTEAHVDLEARLSNKKKLESRIAKLLDKRDGELNSVIEVERELARVRSEVEKLQGLVRVLKHKTDFTTVSVSIREVKDYVPPQAPSFRTRLGETWGMSLSALQQFCEEMALGVVGLLPWLVVLATIGAPILWYLRRIRARELT